MSTSFKSTHTESFHDFFSFSVQSGEKICERIVSLPILQSSGSFWRSPVYYGMHIFHDMNIH